jgi:hypothetical protein
MRAVGGTLKPVTIPRMHGVMRTSSLILDERPHWDARLFTDTHAVGRYLPGGNHVDASRRARPARQGAATDVKLGNCEYMSKCEDNCVSSGKLVNV